MSVFYGQDSLKIQLTTNTDITGATGLAIKYRKADGSTTGSWTATSSNDTTGVIYYDVSSTSVLNSVGDWKIWAYVTFSDGRVAPGVPAVMTVQTEGI